nr:GNAT family N-acetyltransferase [Shewanella baltica]
MSLPTSEYAPTQSLDLIVILFVDPERQKKGIGSALLLFTLEYVKVDVVTVSASLSSVPAYVKYGFKFNGDTGISAGLVYQPMKIELILSHYNQL